MQREIATVAGVEEAEHSASDSGWESPEDSDPEPGPADGAESDCAPDVDEDAEKDAEDAEEPEPVPEAVAAEDGGLFVASKQHRMALVGGMELSEVCLLQEPGLFLVPILMMARFAGSGAVIGGLGHRAARW